MNKKILIFTLLFLALILVGCGQKEKALRVRILCSNETERDERIVMTSGLFNEATSVEESIKLAEEAGFSVKEEYYESQWCGGTFFAAGYYPTLRVGEGEQAWQYVAYPSYVYQSLEEFNNARYGSFFYEIIKKAKESD